jgi:type IV pilus assembly protein PilM
MASSSSVWGIEIGHSSLKALRCRPHPDDPKRLEADAFDFIEYPQLLSEPDAEPEMLIRDALQQFLSRNDVHGHTIGISVPGQKGLAKFVDLPPVESSKIPDIVRFEAKQQIPFPLEEVIWDYQQLAGGSEEDGFALETKVGIFAMKRDEVYRQLSPYDGLDIEVDIVQLTPLALYNYIRFDQLQELPPLTDDDPPPSVVLLSLGCETTEVVVTNGYRVWQRSIPLGGNAFTKALMKAFKLTFAKAEHLKRNATQASNPKQVFQAMRPVFGELVTEVQKSLSFFQNLNKTATIDRVITLGNVMKLPGIRTFLEQNLGYKVEKLEAFKHLSGPAVVAAPQFRENMLSFASCYGLAVQHLAPEHSLSTNLVPPEVVQDRLIRAKKPWAVAAAAVLLLGFSISTLGYWRQWSTVNDSSGFASATQVASGSTGQAQGYLTEFDDKAKKFVSVQEMADRLVSHGGPTREQWQELYSTIGQILPRETKLQRPDPNNREAWWRWIRLRNTIYIRRIEVEYVEDLAQWYTMADQLARKAGQGGATQAPGGEGFGGPQMGPSVPPPPSGEPAADGDATPRPEGSGFIVRLTGHHFHNDQQFPVHERGIDYVRNELISKLAENEIRVPGAIEGESILLPIGFAGIGFPLLTDQVPMRDWDPATGLDEPFPIGGSGGYSGEGSRRGRNPFARGEGSSPYSRGSRGEGSPSAVNTPTNVPMGDQPVELKRIDFQIQFKWQPKSPEQQQLLKQKFLEEQQRLREQEANTPVAEGPDASNSGRRY